MSIGENAATFTQEVKDTFDVSVMVANIKKMSAEDRESAKKKLQEVIKKVSN